MLTIATHAVQYAARKVQCFLLKCGNNPAIIKKKFREVRYVYRFSGGNPAIFLDIRFHNQISYFEEHRQDYIRDVQTPFYAFISELGAAYAAY